MSGYDTQFYGEFKFNETISPQLNKYLKKFSASKRVKWCGLPEIFGIDGAFYYDGMDDAISMYMFGENISLLNPVKVTSHLPPDDQPSSWCNWTPSKDGNSVRWNCRKNSYEYIKWLQYIINNFLGPHGYTLNGKVTYYGDCTTEYINLDGSETSSINSTDSTDSAENDYGEITIIDNIISFTGPVGCWNTDENVQIPVDMSLIIPHYTMIPSITVLISIYLYYLIS